jgi:hypothetical protein
MTKPMLKYFAKQSSLLTVMYEFAPTGQGSGLRVVNIMQNKTEKKVLVGESKFTAAKK